MKNRVAAQTARDRKKLQMDFMEAKLARQTKEFNSLTSIVRILKEQNKMLIEKNSQLINRLQECTCGSSNSDNSPPLNITSSSSSLNSTNVNAHKSAATFSSENTILSDGSSCVVDSIGTPVTIECIESAVLKSLPRIQMQSMGAAVLLRVLVLAMAFSQLNKNQPIQSSCSSSKMEHPMKGMSSSLSALQPSTRNQSLHLLNSSYKKEMLRQLLRSNKSCLPDRLSLTKLSLT